MAQPSSRAWRYTAAKRSLKKLKNNPANGGFIINGTTMCVIGMKFVD